MGGKKKKGLGNKLAKMSEDERARYLQHRADIEEEARRKKEQLVNIYFKNKIKKEEAFAKLNLAKINQHWHQLLRKSKCLEMKSAIHEMRQSIQRLVSAKNNCIEMLLEELDHAEFQYSFNFQTHLNHIDEMIGFHRNYIKQLSEEYDKDRCLVLENAEIEREEMEKFSENETKFFKMLIFGQETIANQDIGQIKEKFRNQLDEHYITTNLEMENMRKSCQKQSNSLWRDITMTLQNYVSFADQNRAHYAQLVSLDKRNQTEITKNNITMKQLEEQIEALKKLEETNKINFDKEINQLNKQQMDVKEELQKVRNSLQKSLKSCDTKLIEMTQISNSAIKHLEAVQEKGEEIMLLSQICQKYQTENDCKLKVTISKEQDEELQELTVEGYQWLDGLDNLWTLYNQAVIDCEAYKSEHRLLLKEKQELLDSLKCTLQK